MNQDENKGTVFDIQRFAVHDGPGIRTLVFLKGCPLRCHWCANPESINFQPELGFIREDCDACGKCAGVCPKQAISLDKELRPSIDREKCDNCGKCIETCLTRALFIYGHQQSAAQVFREVKRDSNFYSNSGGGVTISGGEPLRQSSFVKALFVLCREAGIHTAIETSGFGQSEVFRDIIGITDYVLFDLKCIDPKTHEQLCGRDNKQILENARTLALSGVQFVFRMPVIPGLNDSLDNLASTGVFLKKLGLPKCEIELIPYHRLGLAKYESLGRVYNLRHIVPQTADEFQGVKTTLEKVGVFCRVSV